MKLFSFKTLLLVGLLVGLYYASQRYSIRGLEQLKLVSREDGSAEQDLIPESLKDWTQVKKWIPISHTSSETAKQQTAAAPLTPNKPVTPTVRVATFDLQNFDERKAESVAVQEIIVRILRNFDVIAIQGITSKQRDLLPKLIDRINQDKLAYDYLIGPRTGPIHRSMTLAFIYNTERIETDRYQLYTVQDPGDLIEVDPLVGWFRSKSVAPQRAFTFSFVNLFLSPTRLEQELQILPALVESIQRDGRGEDDIVLAGGFACADSKVVGLRDRKWHFAVENIPTTIGGDEMLDSIAFPPQTADEFTGRSGAIDFLRKFNLNLEQAAQVSQHLPVWCEFFAEEGGYPGYR